MKKTTLISWGSNITVLANLAAGFFHIYWVIIILFIIIHAITRLQFVKAEQVDALTANANHSATRSTIAPPMVKNLASVITAIILAILLYWLGFGASLLAARWI